MKDPKQSCSGRARLLPQCLSLPRGRAACSGNGLDALPAPVPEPAQCGWLRCVGQGVHELHNTSPAAARPSWSSRSCTDISHHGLPHSSPVPCSPRPCRASASSARPRREGLGSIYCCQSMAGGDSSHHPVAAKPDLLIISHN